MKNFTFLPIICCLLFTSYAIGQYSDCNYDGFIDFNAATKLDDNMLIRDTGDVIHTIPTPGLHILKMYPEIVERAHRIMICKLSL